MSPTSVPTSSQAEARAKLVEQSRRHKLREQRKAEASREQQDMAVSSKTSPHFVCFILTVSIFYTFFSFFFFFYSVLLKR